MYVSFVTFIFQFLSGNCLEFVWKVLRPKRQIQSDNQSKKYLYLERCMILKRTVAGKEIARTRAGYKEGRPPVPKERIALAMQLLDSHTYKEVADMTGISTATLARYRRKQKL